MNLTREKAIEAMDAINGAGYTAVLEAAIIPGGRMRFEGHTVDEPSSPALYRISLSALHFDALDMRKFCDLAEGLGLTCRYQLQQFRFVDPADYERRVR